jgi:hypothetical protein
VLFDIRPERRLALTEPDRLSSFRGKQPQRQHDRDFASRKRQRYQGLAIGGRAQRRGILPSGTYRMRSFLGYRGVVDPQHGIGTADELIRLNQLLCLRRPRIPEPGRDEVVQ